ncbi:MAG: pantetheine-phosphate adenylyltransferase [Thermoanaerobaculales bacterium]|nr:pantetheine-phosphate adenylyltransferase [Thermoanaerobaculales bacterium]
MTISREPHPPVAVYPGSFDPIHLGHVAIVERAAKIFPKVIVAVLDNSAKGSLFSPAERLEMMKEIWAGDPSIEVCSFNGLLVNFLHEVGASIVIRGIRAVSDFEYEFMMALMNRHLYPDAETVFLTPREEFTYLSSRVVKEVVALGGDVTGLVPDPVRMRLEARLGKATHPPTR